MKAINWIRSIIGTNGLFNKVDENNKLLKELRWASVFNDSISNSKWLEDKSFSLGRFAAGYPFMYILYRILNDMQPNRILEFGIGQTSKMLYQYASFYKDTFVSTVENDRDWMVFFQRDKILPANVEVVLVDKIITVYNGFETSSISDLGKIVKGKKYDLIIVDGPNGSPRYSRSQVLKLLPDNIDSKHFCVIMDDYNRNGEKETCSELERILAENGIPFHKGVYDGMKETAIYCSNDLKFLITL